MQKQTMTQLKMTILQAQQQFDELLDMIQTEGVVIILTDQEGKEIAAMVPQQAKEFAQNISSKLTPHA